MLVTPNALSATFWAAIEEKKRREDGEEEEEERVKNKECWGLGLESN